MRRIATISSLLSALMLTASPASAGVQMVSGTIAPVLGVSIDASGTGSTGPRDGMTVTTQDRGSQIVITIVPAV